MIIDTGIIKGTNKDIFIFRFIDKEDFDNFISDIETVWSDIEDMKSIKNDTKESINTHINNFIGIFKNRLTDNLKLEEFTYACTLTIDEMAEYTMLLGVIKSMDIVNWHKKYIEAEEECFKLKEQSIELREGIFKTYESPNGDAAEKEMELINLVENIYNKRYSEDNDGE